jgi:hypothetical protein
VLHLILENSGVPQSIPYVGRAGAPALKLSILPQARVKTHYLREPLQPKSLAGQEKSEERIGHTVELFDEPGGDFRCNLEGRGPASRPRK